MTQSVVDLKAQARAALAGHYSILVGAGLLIRLFSAVFSYAFVGYGSSVTGMIADAVVGLLAGLLIAGMYFMLLQIARGREYRFADLFFALKSHPDKAILVSTTAVVVNLLLSWIRSLAISGLLDAALPDTQAMHIFSDPDSVLTIDAFLEGVRSVRWGYLALLGLILLALVLVSTTVQLCVCVVYCVYVDHPDRQIQEIWEESVRLLNMDVSWSGRTAISFAGMLMLGIATLELGFLWIQPYIAMTGVQYYLSKSDMSAQ